MIVDFYSQDCRFESCPGCLVIVADGDGCESKMLIDETRAIALRRREPAVIVPLVPGDIRPIGCPVSASGREGCAG
jgi:hypothetical protein